MQRRTIIRFSVKGKDLLALLAVKSRTISSVTIKVIAYVIGLRLSTILESKEFLKQNGEPDKTMELTVYISD